MKKFEALERLQQQHTASRAVATAGEAPEAGPAVEDREAQGLTEEQLLEVFKQTSVFSVRNMQAQGAGCGPVRNRLAPRGQVDGRVLWGKRREVHPCVAPGSETCARLLALCRPQTAWTTSSLAATTSGAC